MNELDPNPAIPLGDLPEGTPHGSPEGLSQTAKDPEQALANQTGTEVPSLCQNIGEKEDCRTQDLNARPGVQFAMDGVLETKDDCLEMSNPTHLEAGGHLGSPVESLESPFESKGEGFILPQADLTFASPPLSGKRNAPAGSIQVLVIFLLGSFSLCSAMLNLYLFWQARNLGAELERVKPPAKSGLAPRR